MKKILTIFKDDLKKITRNAMAFIIIIGITILPSLYAWFNIAANWDPYGNTGNIKVAVSSLDKGTDIQGVKLNIGDQVVTNLKANKKIGWQFVSKDKAIEGTQSGEYYAALIIPEDFSSCISSVLTSDIKKPKIEYYSNEKKNAVAPKITDKGATSIQTQVNETFIDTSTKALDTIVKNLVGGINANDDGLIKNINSTISEAEKNLSDTNLAINTFCDTVDSMSSLLKSTKTLVPDVKKMSKETVASINDLEKVIKSSESIYNGVISQISTLSESANSLGNEINTLTTTALNTANTDTKDAMNKLNDVKAKCKSLININTEIINTISSINNSLPKRLSAVDKLVYKLEQNNTSINQFTTSISSSIKTLKKSKRLTQTVVSKNKQFVSAITSDISSISNTYNNTISPNLKKLSTNSLSALNNAKSLIKDLGKTTPNLNKSYSDLDSALMQSKKALKGTLSLTNAMTEKIKDVSKKLTDIESSSNYKKLNEILNNNSDLISAFMSSPVEIEATPIYEIENYGSAMAPFYSTLAIWVGGIVLVAILKVKVKDEDDKYKDYRPHQKYFGRYLLFLLIALLQSTLICLGDLFFLHIQCLNPIEFLVAGWVSAFVYSMIIYTLTITFSDVGKAIAVILLVIQIGGSGGTFPIECTPQFFQNVNPFLPFTYTINAMRECVAGMYDNAFLIDLLKLLIYVPCSLVIGLVLRKPLIKLTNFFEKRIEDTTLM